MSEPKKCPCCGCTQLVIEHGDELRCDDCDWIVALRINGEWVEEY